MTTADALAWLLTYALHSTLLLGGVWLLTERGGVRSHRLRDLFWKTALVGGLVTATAQTVIQRSDWSPALARTAAAPVVIDAGALPMPMGTRGAAGRVSGGEGAGVEAAAPTSVPMSVVLVALWVLVGAFGLARLVLSHRRFAQRLGRREPVRSLPVLTLLEDLLVASGTTTRVRLTRSDALGSPVALGVGEICVPGPVLTDLDASQQRGVLAHELAHLRRRDPLWLIGAGIIERVFFFQPLNRVARTSIQESAEYLCDDWAARATGSGLAVAKSLVKVAEWVRGTAAPIPLAGMAERPSQLVGRVRRLTERGRPAERSMRWALPAAAAILLVTAFAAPGIATNRPGLPAESSADGGALLPADLETESARDQDVQPEPEPKPDPRPEPKPRSIMASLQDLKVAVSLNFGGNKADTSALDTLGLAALIAALRDSDAGVRRAAAHSLGNIESARATEPLMAVLRDPDAEVRKNAAWALGNIEDRRAVEGLIGALRDENAEVRNSAAWALGNIEDPRAADALAAALKDESAEVRKSAAWALGQLELTAAPAGLIEAMRDSDAEVREAAIDAVAETGDQRAVPNLAALIGDNSPEVRHSAISALSQMRGATAMQALIDAMKSTDPEVRREAADALGDRD